MGEAVVMALALVLAFGRETGHLFVYVSCHATPCLRAEPDGVH